MDEKNLGVEAEATFHDMATRKGGLCMGANFIIDAETKVVSEAMVWAMGGIWYIKHYEPNDPEYRNIYAIALSNRRTLWRMPAS